MITAPLGALPAETAALFGGKAAGLDRLVRAGFAVPPGFALAAAAFEPDSGTLTEPGRAAAHAALATLAGPVAVRSSGLGEDARVASFAGQATSRLNVTEPNAILAAIEHVARSFKTNSARVYAAEIGQRVQATGVVVQEMLPADRAGVLFTTDPTDPTGSCLAIESAWGLGEAVVAGRVTPDRFQLDRATGRVLHQQPGDKSVERIRTGWEPVDPARRFTLTLDEPALHRLTALALQVEAAFGEPCDVEWASVGEHVWLLQARPITGITAPERERVRAEVIATCRAAIPRDRLTAWVRHDLSATLPAPTPMTWAVLQSLIRADGGFGRVNQRLGSPPDPALQGESVFTLIAGRPRVDLDRLPRMQGANPLIRYPIERYKTNPELARAPQPVLAPPRGVRGWLALPRLAWHIVRTGSGARRLAPTFANSFTTTTLPNFLSAARTMFATTDWPRLTDEQLRAVISDWTHRTLVEFAGESLINAVLADLAWQTGSKLLRPKLGAERAATALAELAAGQVTPPPFNLALALQQLRRGELHRDQFLEQFGHRGPAEMELAEPRWHEIPDQLPTPETPTTPDPFADLHARLAALAGTPPPTSEPETLDRIAAEARLTRPFQAQLTREVERLRTYLGLREAGRQALTAGTAILRRALVTLADRHDLGRGIFELVPAELPNLGQTDFRARIAERRHRRRIELSLELPEVLVSDDLDAIGRPLPTPPDAPERRGVGVSPGTAEGLAEVRFDPTGPPPSGPVILVCPNMDPAWVPMFPNVVGLVLETGGVLSHGAIVARELGRPAVAGVPDATTWLRTGDRVRLDGTTGRITKLSFCK